MPTSFIYEGELSEYQEDLDHDLHEISDIRVVEAVDGEIPEEIIKEVTYESLYIEDELTPGNLLEGLEESKKRRTP